MKMTTKEEVIEAIILKKTVYKENDCILHIYSREYGKISVMAKGIQKMSSKNARACQELMISEMTLHVKKGISTLLRATPVDYLRHIRESLDSEIIANYIVEYFYRYAEENQPIEKEYEQLSLSLKALDQGYDPLLIYLLFNVFILENNGVSLDVDGCVKCGSTHVVSISLQDGGFLCEKHLEQHPVYDVKVLKAFRHIHKIPLQSIDQIHIDEETCHQLIPIIEGFVEEYTGIALKTSKFIRQIV